MSTPRRAKCSAAIVGNAGGESLEALVADRIRKPFTTIAEFRARLPEGATLASDVALSVKSSYFYVTIEARQGTTPVACPRAPAPRRRRQARDRLADRRMTGWVE